LHGKEKGVLETQTRRKKDSSSCFSLVWFGLVFFGMQWVVFLLVDFQLAD